VEERRAERESLPRGEGKQATTQSLGPPPTLSSFDAPGCLLLFFAFPLQLLPLPSLFRRSIILAHVPDGRDAQIERTND